MSVVLPKTLSLHSPSSTLRFLLCIGLVNCVVASPLIILFKYFLLFSAMPSYHILIPFLISSLVLLSGQDLLNICLLPLSFYFVSHLFEPFPAADFQCAMRERDETSADTLDWFGSGLSLDVSFPLFAFLVPLQRIQAEHTALPRCMLDTDKGYIAVDVMVHDGEGDCKPLDDEGYGTRINKK
jgi:hypothetical protein